MPLARSVEAGRMITCRSNPLSSDACQKTNEIVLKLFTALNHMFSRERCLAGAIGTVCEGRAYHDLQKQSSVLRCMSKG